MGYVLVLLDDDNNQINYWPLEAEDWAFLSHILAEIEDVLLGESPEATNDEENTYSPYPKARRPRKKRRQAQGR